MEETMTIGELKNSLKGYKNTDKVYMVNDWDIVNENGELTELSALRSVSSQRVYGEDGIKTEVLLEF